MEEMTENEVRNTLREGRYGHLGLCKDGNAYVIPMWYGYTGSELYFAGHHGMKSDYIEGTRRACFEVGWQTSDDEWASVLVYGPLERVTSDDDKLVAMDALMERPLPPAEGTSETGEPAHAEPREYYRLTIEEATGRKSQRHVGGEEEELEVLGA